MNFNEIAATIAAHLESMAPNRPVSGPPRTVTYDKMPCCTYDEALAKAQRGADETGRAFGLECIKSAWTGRKAVIASEKGMGDRWNVFSLPPPAQRAGHELRCQVVMPMKWGTR